MIESREACAKDDSIRRQRGDEQALQVGAVNEKAVAFEIACELDDVNLGHYAAVRP